jgi:hypothetical protein
MLFFSVALFHLKTFSKHDVLFRVFVAIERVLVTVAPHRRYLYCNLQVGLAWSNDPENYVGGRIATGMALHASQV